MEEKTPAKQDNIKKILLALLLISFSANIYFLFRTNSQSAEKERILVQVDSLAGIKKMLDDDIQNINFELDQFKGKNIQLDSLLVKANKEISAKQAKIQKLMRENGDIKLLQRQLEELRMIRDQYRVQIDQLIAENKELKNLNLDLSQRVDNLAKEKTNLAEKVETASVLKAEAFNIKTFREKSKGSISETDRAKKVTRVTASLTLGENKVAPKGERNLVFRLIGPNGMVMADPAGGSGSFTSKETGRNQEYTLKKVIDYNNDREEVSFEYNQLDDFKAGLYIAEIYLDGKMMASNKFTLK
jgi:hypothetical protein